MVNQDCTHTVFSWRLSVPEAPVSRNNPWLCTGCGQPVQLGEDGKPELAPEPQDMSFEADKTSDLGAPGTTAHRQLVAGFTALGQISSVEEQATKAQLHFLGSLAASVYEIRELMAEEPEPIQFQELDVNRNPVAVHQCQAADSEDRQCCMVQHYPEHGHLVRDEHGHLHYFQDSEANYPAPGDWRATGYVGGASAPEPAIEGDDEQAPAP